MSSVIWRISRGRFASIVCPLESVGAEGGKLPAQPWTGKHAVGPLEPRNGKKRKAATSKASADDATSNGGRAHAARQG
jgi:hypothetical protein